ncbi:hypothetical protein B0T10DRAFT_563172 [Thelonectria olida]|uniref:Apple domain-containing protein n=1 Tax=Thelonectria olida TaxID=1576542 RepID=A0A9P8W1X6_9HYPO|nr:hypothetical protein B0T10DRAFT_563172 [Thelonectria olida]
MALLKLLALGLAALAASPVNAGPCKTPDGCALTERFIRERDLVDRMAFPIVCADAETYPGTGQITTIYESMTVGECATRCNNFANCRSIFYGSDSCTLLYVFVGASSPVDSPGITSRQYDLACFTCPVHRDAL